MGIVGIDGRAGGGSGFSAVRVATIPDGGNLDHDALGGFLAHVPSPNSRRISSCGMPSPRVSDARARRSASAVSGVISSSSTGAKTSERASGSTIASSRLRTALSLLGRQHVQQRVGLGGVRERDRVPWFSSWLQKLGHGQGRTWASSAVRGDRPTASVEIVYIIQYTL